jgi:succinylarginine dihydrolase
MEVNFDGIVGPTHTFGGLSNDDMASIGNRQLPSNPKQAALQGLKKMKLLHDLGIPQGVLPPQERPFIPILRKLGYSGTDIEIIRNLKKTDLSLLAACSSSASMWAANAATISPSCDSIDKKVHFTPANLLTKFHRSFEAPTTGKILSRIFPNPTFFMHHQPLPYHTDYADEGAANHTRFCTSFEQPGIQLFVYGRSSDSNSNLSQRFIPRQTKEASQSISRLHELPSDRVLFAQQNPEAIDAGVFHNDVISVGHQHFFLYHEKAFVNTPKVIEELQHLFYRQCKESLICFEVKEEEVTLSDAVKTYLFNSQIITLQNQTMALIAPKECQELAQISDFIQNKLCHGQSPIRQVIFQDVGESMRNGGGPACLRIRVVLQSHEWDAVHRSVIFTNELYNKLVAWIEKNYRDRLSLEDLGDPLLLEEGRTALDELTQILQLDSIYPFQMANLTS